MGSKTRFDLIHKRLLYMISYINMVGVFSSLWEFVCGCLFYVIGFIARYLFRLLEKNDEKNHEVDRIDNHGETKSEEEKSKDCDDSETCSLISSSAKKYEVFALKNINGYVEEPKAMNFTVQELYLGSELILDEEKESSESEISRDIDDVFEFGAQEEEYWKSKFDFFSAKKDIFDGFSEETNKALSFDDRRVVEAEDFRAIDKESEIGSEISSVEGEFDEKKELHEVVDSPESSLLYKHDLISEDVDSDSAEIVQLPNVTSQEDHDIVDSSITCEKNIDQPIIQEEKSESESEDEYIEFELKTSSTEFREVVKAIEEKEDRKGGDFGDKSEFEWDHEDVIERLKWELRNARAGGLPTILEEESPDGEESLAEAEKGNANLRPMKIDLKFGYKERIEEVQKVYKIYAERMRKLDILNNQTMHALGFLQLKDQSKSTTPKQKPTTKSFFPRIGQRQNDASSALKYDAKLQNDFELVYVGQLCLSWEILRWQHGRVRDLLQNDDAQLCRRYSHVASELQLFQVLIQRFVEDESFRGPRVQNYVKNRCVIRSLIQVPMIRDDSVKDKQHVVDENEDCVSCEILDKIIVDSMFTFWEFVRSGKSVDSKVSHQSVSELADSKLLVDIRKEFQKKERKVKDMQRSGNCVVKKLQKNQEQGRIQHDLLLAQVELRLVSRVLEMPRLSRDQLVWCQHKLNQISFANKKVHLETSFLLFPC